MIVHLLQRVETDTSPVSSNNRLGSTLTIGSVAQRTVVTVEFVAQGTVETVTIINQYTFLI